MGKPRRPRRVRRVVPYPKASVLCVVRRKVLAEAPAFRRAFARYLDSSRLTDVYVESNR